MGSVAALLVERGPGTDRWLVVGARFPGAEGTEVLHN
jgi:hypothetical protein